MKFLLFFICAWALACGPKNKNLKIEPEFAPLFEIYLSKAPNWGYIDDLESIEFGDPGDENLGVTRSWDTNFGPMKTGRARKIIMRRETFDSAMGQRAFLHELGHALHNLKHTENPDDIMSGDSSESEEREEWWKENLINRLDVMFSEFPKDVKATPLPPYKGF